MAKMLSTTDVLFPYWVTIVQIPEKSNINYKYLILRDENEVIWEGIENNRSLEIRGSTMTVDDGPFGNMRSDDEHSVIVEKEPNILVASPTQTREEDIEDAIKIRREQKTNRHIIGTAIKERKKKKKEKKRMDEEERKVEIEHPKQGEKGEIPKEKLASEKITTQLISIPIPKPETKSASLSLHPNIPKSTNEPTSLEQKNPAEPSSLLSQEDSALKGREKTVESPIPAKEMKIIEEKEEGKEITTKKKTKKEWAQSMISMNKKESTMTTDEPKTKKKKKGLKKLLIKIFN